MTLRKKIIILVIVLAVMLISALVIVKLYRPNQTIIIDNTTVGNFKNLSFIYTEDNGSVPPEYYQKTIITFKESDTGKITGELTYNDSDGKISKKETVLITADHFRQLISVAQLIGTKNKDLGGCTGGNSQTVQILRADKVIFTASNYNCAEKSSNQSLVTFVEEMQRIMAVDNPKVK